MFCETEGGQRLYHLRGGCSTGFKDPRVVSESGEYFVESWREEN